MFDSTWNSVSNTYYTCLIRQIASNDEIGECIGSFKLSLDLKNKTKIWPTVLTVKDF